MNAFTERNSNMSTESKKSAPWWAKLIGTTFILIPSGAIILLSLLWIIKQLLLAVFV